MSFPGALAPVPAFQLRCAWFAVLSEVGPGLGIHTWQVDTCCGCPLHLGHLRFALSGPFEELCFSVIIQYGSSVFCFLEMLSVSWGGHTCPSNFINTATLPTRRYVLHLTILGYDVSVTISLLSHHLFPYEHASDQTPFLYWTQQMLLITGPRTTRACVSCVLSSWSALRKHFALLLGSSVSADSRASLNRSLLL